MKRKFKITLYEGSLIDKRKLNKFNPTLIEKGQTKWGNLIEITLSIDELKEIQREMTKHYEGPEPWYTFGYSVVNPNELICAFGSDDGNGGKIFMFKKSEKREYEKVLKYGVSKGIPKDEMDFLQLLK